MKLSIVLFILCLHTVNFILAVENDTESTVSENQVEGTVTRPITTTFDGAEQLCKRPEDDLASENLYQKFALSYVKPHIEIQTELFGLLSVLGRSEVKSPLIPSASGQLNVGHGLNDKNESPLKARFIPVLLSPIDIVQILSVASDNVWNLPVNDLYDVLTNGLMDINSTWTEKKKRRELDDSKFCLNDDKKREAIVELYRPFFQHLSKDPTILLSSNVYTMIKNFESPRNLIDLKTFVNYLNYNDTNIVNVYKAIDNLNLHISKQTFGTLGQADGFDLASRARMVLGMQIGRFTPAIFVNTLYYRSTWSNISPFRSIGLQDFDQGQVQEEGRKTEFLETFGQFSVYQNDSISAVRIPLERSTEGHRKYLTLIQNKVNLSNKSGKQLNLESFDSMDVEEILRRLEEVPKIPVTVQVPSFNFSTQHPMRYLLTALGLYETVCKPTALFDAMCVKRKTKDMLDLLCLDHMLRNEGDVTKCDKLVRNLEYLSSPCPLGLNYPKGAACLPPTGSDPEGTSDSGQEDRGDICHKHQIDQSPMMLFNMVQSAQVRLDIRGFQVASATDTSLNNRVIYSLLESIRTTKRYRERRQAPVNQPQSNGQFHEIPPSPSHPHLNQNYLKLPRTIVENILKDANMRGHQGPVVVLMNNVTPQTDTQTPDDVTLRFDSPFLFVLEDEKMGPLFVGTVQGTQAEYEKILTGKNLHKQAQDKFSSRRSMDIMNKVYWGCNMFPFFY